MVDGPRRTQRGARRRRTGDDRADHGRGDVHDGLRLGAGHRWTRRRLDEAPPGGRQRPTLPRILGVLIVLAALAVGTEERLAGGVPLWAPLLPFASGTLTAVQQAFNGRIRAASGSALVATATNFATGPLALVLATALVMAAGARWTDFPTAPGQWWSLLGGAFGVVFIGLTSLTVARLGVLLLSLFSLFGNLLGAMLLDALRRCRARS